MGSWKIIPKKFHAICKQDPRLEDPSRLVLVFTGPRWCTRVLAILVVQICIVPGLQRFRFPRIRFLVLFYLFFPIFCLVFLRNFLGSSCSGPRSCALAGCDDVVSTMPDALAGCDDVVSTMPDALMGCDDVVSTMPDALMDVQLCFTTIVEARIVTRKGGRPWSLHLGQLRGPRRKLGS